MEKKIKNDERWRERVQKFERIRVGDILANDRNAKNHPKKQNDAVSQSLDAIGKAGTLMAYYSARNGGNLTLWDGHARQGLNQNEIWWVAITDLTDAEADQMLLTYDPIAAMAEWDKELLSQLLDANDTLGGDLAALADNIAAGSGLFGDTDYSKKNNEIDIESISDLVVLELRFKLDDYLFVKKALGENAEDSIIKILKNV